MVDDAIDEDTDVMTTFIASNAFCALTVAERVWCAAKQAQYNLTNKLIRKAMLQNGTRLDYHGPMACEAHMMIRGMVERGENAHFGRSVIENVLKCKDFNNVREIREDVESAESL